MSIKPFLEVINCWSGGTGPGHNVPVRCSKCGKELLYNGQTWCLACGMENYNKVYAEIVRDRRRKFLKSSSTFAAPVVRILDI